MAVVLCYVTSRGSLCAPIGLELDVPTGGDTGRCPPSQNGLRCEMEVGHHGSHMHVVDTQHRSDPPATRGWMLLRWTQDMLIIEGHAGVGL